jgi:hypothetical protein
MELLEIQEKLKTDFEKRIKSIQNEIDRCDEYKNKITDLELENKSKISQIFSSISNKLY